MQGNFSDEIGHRFNLGPFHLWDNFIDEILLHDTTKSYLRKQIETERIVAKSLDKSGSFTSFQRKKTPICNLILTLQLQIRQNLCFVKRKTVHKIGNMIS